MSRPPPPSPSPSSPPPYKVVSPRQLERFRISGDKNIIPADATKLEIMESGTPKVSGVYKLCLTETGAITSINVVKSMGYSAYDHRIVATMQTWRYRPFTVDGEALPVCTTVQFVYTQTH